MRRGEVFRSAQFSNLGDDDAERLGNPGIDRICDFRTHEESVAQPNVLPDRVVCIAIDILAEMRDGFGTIEVYFTEGLGFDQAMNDRLREIFIEKD